MAVMKGTQMAAEAIRAAGKKGVVINTASMGGLLPLPETQLCWGFLDVAVYP